MIIGQNQSNNFSQGQSSITFKDFVMGDRIKKVTTHDLFQLTRDHQTYVAKLFKPEFHHNYELELNILRQLNHPNIVSLIYNQNADHESMGMWNCDMLILKWAQHGSLNEYIPANGKLPESMARIVFKEMISGLKYAANIEPNGIIHPNLLPSSILLDSQRHVQICGWSKQPQVKPKAQLVKDLLFNCCEILILMITGFVPFVKKDPKTDPYYKFVRPDYINKFWQIFQKKMSSKYKSFQFSAQVKELIQKILLEEWTTFEQIQSSSWMKLPTVTHEQFNKYLSALQIEALNKRLGLLKKQHQKSQQKRKILMQYEEETMRGSSNRSSGQYDFFIQDFYENFYSKQDVPASQCSELIRLFDDTPSFVVATLKQQLRKLENQEIDFIFGGQFKLDNFVLQKDGNEVCLKLQFCETNSELMDPEEEFQIRVKALIRLFKNQKNHLYGQVKILESNMCEYYASMVMGFIEDRIRQNKA